MSKQKVVAFREEASDVTFEYLNYILDEGQDIILANETMYGIEDILALAFLNEELERAVDKGRLVLNSYKLGLASDEEVSDSNKALKNIYGMIFNTVMSLLTDDEVLELKNKFDGQILA